MGATIICVPVSSMRVNRHTTAPDHRSEKVPGLSDTGTQIIVAPINKSPSTHGGNDGE
jgi:hypothetical protein